MQRMWADGRVLSASQRQKKREADKIRQRASRHHSATLLAHLQSKVAALHDEPASEIPQAVFSGDVEDISNPQAQIGDRKSLDDVDSRACQTIFCAALARTANLPGNRICEDMNMNQDAIIRAVTQGWNEVVNRYNTLCPLWEILRLLDSRMFRYAGTMTRFCTLFMIYRMLLCLVGINDVSSLPAWYRPRPTQMVLEHPIVVDVLPWPGLRERACLDLDLIASNKFWNDVIYCFRFIWLYTDAEAVEISPSSRLFSFSSAFRN